MLGYVYRPMLKITLTCFAFHCQVSTSYNNMHAGSEPK